MVQADARTSVFRDRARWVERVIPQTVMHISRATNGNQICPAGESSAERAGRKTRSVIVLKYFMGLLEATISPLGAARY